MLFIIIPRTQNGVTPRMIASQEGHSDIVKILLGKGADTKLTWKVYVVTIIDELVL